MRHTRNDGQSAGEVAVPLAVIAFFEKVVTDDEWGPTLRTALLLALPVLTVLTFVLLLTAYCGPLGLAGGLGGSCLLAGAGAARRRSSKARPPRVGAAEPPPQLESN